MQVGVRVAQPIEQGGPIVSQLIVVIDGDRNLGLVRPQPIDCQLDQSAGYAALGTAVVCDHDHALGAIRSQLAGEVGHQLGIRQSPAHLIRTVLVIEAVRHHGLGHGFPLLVSMDRNLGLDRGTRRRGSVLADLTTRRGAVGQRILPR